MFQKRKNLDDIINKNNSIIKEKNISLDQLKIIESIASLSLRDELIIQIEKVPNNKITFEVNDESNLLDNLDINQNTSEKLTQLQSILNLFRKFKN